MQLLALFMLLSSQPPRLLRKPHPPVGTGGIRSPDPGGSQQATDYSALTSL